MRDYSYTLSRLPELKKELEEKNMTVCACMGPQGKDPVCPCRMRAMGKLPSNQWVNEDRYRLTEVLKDIFQAEDHMSDKGYEEAPLEDIPKRTDPWDDWKPNEDIE